MISRPGFLNVEEAEDDLDLGDLLTEALVERMHSSATGSGQLIYVDAKDVAGSCSPTGAYSVESGTVLLRLKLKRDGEPVLDEEFAASEASVGGLVDQLVEKVVAACPVN